MSVRIAALVALLSAPAVSANDSFTAAQEERLGELVREYILENPEIIEDAIFALQDKRQAELEAEQRASVAMLSEELYNDPRDFSVGPEGAPVTIVEFFDYNCGYCKRVAGWIKDTLEEHEGQVRVVFKEAPIFAERLDGSGAAARATLAAIPQDKFLDLHFAFMETRGTLTRDQVTDIAKKEGLNLRWLTNAMEDPAHTEHLADNLVLAEALGMTGTPFFIVNGEPVEGANTPRLDILVAEALSASDGTASGSE